MQVGAEAAQVGDDALRGQRLQPGDGLGGVRLVVEQHELERHLLAAHRHAAGRVDLLDRDLVAGAHLGAAGAVAAGQRHHRADLDRLGPGPGSGPSASRARTSSVSSLIECPPSRVRIIESASHAPQTTRAVSATRCELASLVLGRELVALHGRGEAALRAESQAIERHQPGRLVDARAQLVHRLEARLLARHQPQHHVAVLRHRAQRLEAARALVVVLQQEALEAALAEHARDGLVAAAGVEHRLVVAAADVQAERDARMAADHRVVHLDARVDEPVGIAAPLAVALAQRGIEQRRVLRARRSGCRCSPAGPAPRPRGA